MKKWYLGSSSYVKSLYGAAREFRVEEPLKGYRQWVLDELVARARRNGVI